MILDLTQGFGDFPEYKLFKFPDGSIKFELKKDIEFRVSTGNIINDMYSVHPGDKAIHPIKNWIKNLKK